MSQTTPVIGYPHYTNIAIAVPLTGRPLVPYFVYAFQNLHPPMNSNVIYMTNFNERHIPMPGAVADLRNWYTEQAIANKCKYLFFIDEDVTPPPHALRQLIFQMEHHPDAWAIGGVVCHKAKPTSPMIFRGNGNGPYWDWKLGEFFEVSGIGMGCTLLRVEPFKTLEKPWFKTVDNMEAFWDGIPKAEVWTEDLYWCDKAIKAGGKVYADTSILCDHWDLATGQPTSLAPGSYPLRRATTARKGQKKIVDLGCGESPYQTDEGDVLRVDIRDDVNPDYRADLRKLPFANAEFDVVYSSHVLEHFPRADIGKVLDEWIRILKPDGEFRLIVPNLEWAADQIKLGAMNDDVLNVLYGAQTYGENFHQMGFTPAALTSMLKERGFKRMDVELVGYNLCIRAWREPPADLPELGTPPAKTVATNGHGKVKGKKVLSKVDKLAKKRK